MALTLPYLFEYGVEIGYGIIYLILAITTILKYKKTGNKLAFFFFIGFLLLGFSGVYGGIAGTLSKSGYEMIPVVGNKILEIYEGLVFIALIFFIIGLIKI
ncbi:MAG: hypothetical protein ACP6IY_14580 [Promethearchaeia archaeon]